MHVGSWMNVTLTSSSWVAADHALFITNVPMRKLVLLHVVWREKKRWETRRFGCSYLSSFILQQISVILHWLHVKGVHVPYFLTCGLDSSTSWRSGWSYTWLQNKSRKYRHLDSCERNSARIWYKTYIYIYSEDWRWI